MTQTETAQLMDLLATAYPRYYAGKTEQERRRALLLWWEMLRDYPLDTVKAAAKALIATQKFPPAVSEVLEKIRLLVKPEGLNEGAAWALVLKAVRNAGYHAKSEYAALPPEVKAAIGSPETLRSWALADEGDLSTVIQSNFMRAFRARAARQQEYDALPEDIEALALGLGGFPGKMLAEGQKAEG